MVGCVRVVVLLLVRRRGRCMVVVVVAARDSVCMAGGCAMLHVVVLPPGVPLVLSPLRLRFPRIPFLPAVRARRCEWRRPAAAAAEVCCRCC